MEGKIYNIEDYVGKITQGDCLPILQGFKDKSVNMIVTSPPYNMKKEYDKDTTIDEYINEQNQIIQECIRVLKNNGSICWQTGNYVKNNEIIPLDIILYNSFCENRLKLRNRIVWHFGHGLHCKKRFSGRYETILWFTRGDNYTFNLDDIRIPQKYPRKKHFKGTNKGQFSCNPKGKNPSDVWDISNIKNNHPEKTEHPCQFPEQLIKRLILGLSNKNDIILDPFLGSGTTAVVAEELNRRWIGIELKQKYCNIAKKRITERKF